MTTKIEWCDAVWNPVTGCSHISEGCRYCYAEREFPRLAANPKNPAYQGRTFTDVACHPERLDEPLKRKKPTRYFVNSMSDLFHPAVPLDFIDRVFAVMALAPHHTFIILTKRPERALEYFRGVGQTPRRDWIVVAKFQEEFRRGKYTDSTTRWPLPNVWGLVSVEDQQTADKRIPEILQCPFAVRGASYEPALSGVDFTALDYTDKARAILKDACGPDAAEGVLDGSHRINALTGEWTDGWDGGVENKLDWIVAGGESGPNARPSHPDWFRQVRDDCIAAGVPFFFKQHGEYIQMVDLGGFHEYTPDVQAQIIRREVVAFGPPTMIRVGKKRAGRLLDGVEWSQFPEVNHDI